jgi:uncharacterized repeat protein (TIGR03803 family)
LVTLTAGENGPAGLAVGGGYVYFTDYAGGAADAGSVRRVPVAGGAPEVLAAGLSGPMGIGADGANVYVANRYGSNVLSVPVSGGAVPGIVATVPGGLQPLALAVDQTGVYWTDTTDTWVGGDVRMAPMDGGAPVVLAPSQVIAGAPTGGVALDSARVYWANQPATPSGMSELRAISKGAGPIVPVATGAVFVDALAVSGSNLYFSYGNPPQGTYVVPVSGGDPVPFSGGSLALTVDGVTLYFSQVVGDHTEIGAMPLDGGGGETLFSGPYVWGLVTDDTSLYWVDNVAGVVQKLTPK